MKFAESDQYSEDLLMAQYDVSEIITHELMKGEVREDFLITTLESCSDPKPKLVKGTISDGRDDAGQLDIILCRPYAHLRHMGAQCFVAKNDALWGPSGVRRTMCTTSDTSRRKRQGCRARSVR